MKSERNITVELNKINKYKKEIKNLDFALVNHNRRSPSELFNFDSMPGSARATSKFNVLYSKENYSQQNKSVVSMESIVQ